MQKCEAPATPTTDMKRYGHHLPVMMPPRRVCTGNGRKDKNNRYKDIVIIKIMITSKLVSKERSVCVPTILIMRIGSTVLTMRIS